MSITRKHIIILLILMGALVIVCAASAENAGAAKASKTKVKIHNFKSGELWAPKATKLPNGDAIAGYVEYSSNSQFARGTGVVAWYYGFGNEDIDPHHTKLVKAKFYFKDSKGNKKTKIAKGDGGHISTSLIEGYTPYKAKVWYTTY